MQPFNQSVGTINSCKKSAVRPFIHMYLFMRANFLTERLPKQRLIHYIYARDAFTVLHIQKMKLNNLFD